MEGEKGGGWKEENREACGKRGGEDKRGKMEEGERKEEGMLMNQLSSNFFFNCLLLEAKNNLGDNPIKTYFCWYDRILTVKVLVNMKCQQVCTQDSQSFRIQPIIL